MTIDDRLGSLDVRGDEATMTFRRRLPHSIDAVWSAITDPVQRAAWFGATTIEPRAGGTIAMLPHDPPAAAEAKQMTGRILTWQPPSATEPRTAVLEHEWRQRIVEEGSVRYELTADGDDATVLVFVHRGLSVRNAQGFIPGTHAFLDRLAAHLAADELPDWGRRYAELAPAYEQTAGAWR
ncbi:SRPBCC family protein [Dactylosporangium sp. NPDC000521]|uniref:SRPBCC family protein n=1 Tax=Dactylosporangium sp. NPDC000521 TaxID=3363975 RepID=UPI003696508E